MTTVAVPHINLLDPGFYVDPWDAYRWLRDESPVHWDPAQKVWGISRHEDVLIVEKDVVLYSSSRGSRPQIDLTADNSMINLDDPIHQRQRSTVVPRFTPRAMRGHEQRVRALADSILDEALAGGVRTFEAVEQVASRLPAQVVAELLGYAPQQWTLVRWLSEATTLSAGQTRADGSGYAPSADSTAALLAWSEATTEIIHARRDEPRDDVISLWCHSETEGVVWDDRRILDETLLIVDGGAETTRTVIASIIRELALRPNVQRQLRECPDMLPGAVEEFIRWVSPVINMKRTVTRDHELRGQSLRKGDDLLLLYPSANRDERVYDRPDEFDITRKMSTKHVAFGWGSHLCLGAPLARLELRVMFERLLSRLPEWRLVPGTEPKIVPATFARAYDAVHIEF